MGTWAAPHASKWQDRWEWEHTLLPSLLTLAGLSAASLASAGVTAFGNQVHPDRRRGLASAAVKGVWTEDELVVWGGYLTRFDRERYDKGAAYDPETYSWRSLADGPLPPGYDAMGAWTGEEVIVVVSPMGIQPQDYPKFAHAAGYYPESDTWRDLPRPPFVTNVSPPSPYLDGRLLVEPEWQGRRR